MASRIFLHIGGEKTGTTTLQCFLTRNAEALKRSGFYYPCEGDDIFFEREAHFPIAARFMEERAEFISQANQDALPFVMQALARKLSDINERVILSCEQLSSRLTKVSQLLALRDALPADEIKIVFYAREPSSLALAEWSTSIRCGAKHEFNVEDVNPEKAYYNHLERLKLWGGVFGEENLIVREYNRSRLVGADVRRDFCASLGIDFGGMRIEEEQNQSFDVQRLEVLRFINCALAEFEGSGMEWRKAQKVRDLLSAYIPPTGALDDLLDESERASIKLKFEAVNRELNERYFAGQLSEDWFPNLNSNAAVRRRPYKPPTDISAVLRETIIRMAGERTVA